MKKYPPRIEIGDPQEVKHRGKVIGYLQKEKCWHRGNERYEMGWLAGCEGLLVPTLRGFRLKAEAVAWVKSEAAG